MEIQDKKVLSVTREYEVSTGLDNFFSYCSQEFEIVLDKLQTTWVLLLNKSGNCFSACLRKIKSSSDDFVVSVLFELPNNKKIQKQYDGSLLSSDDWFSVGSLTGNIKITLTEKLICIPYDPIKEELLLSNLNRDFKFVCSDGETVLANRSLISAYSDVMKTMLEAPMLESKNNTAKLNDIDSLTMQEVMRFMMIGRVNDIEMHVLGLLYSADKYGISDLRELCVTAMKRRLNSKNVIDYLMTACKYKDHDLHKWCLSFVEICSEPINDTELEKLKKFDSLLHSTVTYLLSRKDKMQIKPLKLIMTYSNDSRPPYH